MQATTTKPALTFTGIPLEYWRAEVRRDCAASLARLRAIVAARGADFEKTVARLALAQREINAAHMATGEL